MKQRRGKKVGNEIADFDERDYRERVLEIVRKIPVGKVMTYGQIAAILGDGYTPRTVGFVMHAASGDDVPWHRVVNSSGGCSTARITLPPDLQQKLLEREGVEFNARERCRLDDYRYFP